MFRTFVVVALGLLLASLAPVSAQQGPYKFELNKTYRYQTVTTTEMLQDFGGQSFTMSTESRQYARLVADALLPDGSYHIVQTLDSMRTAIESPMGTQQAGKESDGTTSSFVMRPDGKIVHRDSSGGADGVGALAQSFQSSSGMLALMTGAEFAPGKSWVAVTVDTAGKGDDPMITTRTMTYTVQGTKSIGGRECHEIAFKGSTTMHGTMEQQGMKLSMQMEGSDTGTLYFDAKAGLMVESTTKGTADMNIGLEGGGMGNGTSSISTNSVTRHIPD